MQTAENILSKMYIEGALMSKSRNIALNFMSTLAKTLSDQVSEVLLCSLK